MQRRLWKASIAICIILFFFLAIFWLAVEVRLFPAPDERTIFVLEFAEACAILIFALELYSIYRQTPDKKKFLAQHWLAIIAILPIGIMVRAARMFQSVGAFRALEAPLGLAKADLLVPAISVSARPAFALQKWLANFQIFRDFFALAGKLAKRAFK